MVTMCTLMLTVLFHLLGSHASSKKKNKKKKHGLYRLEDALLPHSIKFKWLLFQLGNWSLYLNEQCKPPSFYSLLRISQYFNKNII